MVASVYFTEESHLRMLIYISCVRAILEAKPSAIDGTPVQHFKTSLSSNDIKGSSSTEKPLGIQAFEIKIHGLIQSWKQSILKSSDELHLHQPCSTFSVIPVETATYQL